MGHVQVTQYCTTCGTKMKKTLVPVDRYDSETGKREIVLKFQCPKYRFWKFGHYEVIINTLTHLKEIPDDPD